MEEDCETAVRSISCVANFGLNTVWLETSG